MYPIRIGRPRDRHASVERTVRRYTGLNLAIILKPKFIWKDGGSQKKAITQLL